MDKNVIINRKRKLLLNTITAITNLVMAAISTFLISAKVIKIYGTLRPRNQDFQNIQNNPNMRNIQYNPNISKEQSFKSIKKEHIQ